MSALEVLPLIKEEWWDIDIPIYPYIEYRKGIMADAPFSFSSREL